LISNSLKHAFENNEEGNIQLSIKMINQDSFIIKYQDNGQWIKKTKESTFGLELINTFTEQLDGKLNRYSDENGTTYTFKLKNIE
jgi:two-component sensor histidine kinase